MSEFPTAASELATTALEVTDAVLEPSATIPTTPADPNTTTDVVADAVTPSSTAAAAMSRTGFTIINAVVTGRK